MEAPIWNLESLSSAKKWVGVILIIYKNTVHFVILKYPCLPKSNRIYPYRPLLGVHSGKSGDFCILSTSANLHFSSSSRCWNSRTTTTFHFKPWIFHRMSGLGFEPSRTHRMVPRNLAEPRFATVKSAQSNRDGGRQRDFKLVKVPTQTFAPPSNLDLPRF